MGQLLNKWLQSAFSKHYLQKKSIFSAQIMNFMNEISLSDTPANRYG